ncbi:MAG: glycine cleavage system transcriptional repressor [Solirubrobacteraceae bacterium]|nr:glycine cleavage system transcriptional repressor [Solirubrobacteraceae bacterium]
MPSYALSAVGADRPGIIAAIAERLVAHGANVTDSHMGILRGSFAMTLVIEGELDEDALRADLDEDASRLELDALLLREVHAGHGIPDSATHVVSVYGADHPGILAAVTGALAAAGANVCDLRTRLVEADAVYVMVVDVAVPEGTDPGVLETALAAVGEREGVDVTLRPADSDLL